jgi:hypothetical protein
LEYITAIANLNRRAGHRTAVLKHYHQQIKRQLGQRYRIDPTQSDEDYVIELSQARPDLDSEALSSLLKRLQKPKVSEREMVQLAHQAAKWLTR